MKLLEEVDEECAWALPPPQPILIANPGKLKPSAICSTNPLQMSEKYPLPVFTFPHHPPQLDIPEHNLTAKGLTESAELGVFEIEKYRLTLMIPKTSWRLATKSEFVEDEMAKKFEVKISKSWIENAPIVCRLRLCVLRQKLVT